MTFVSFYAIILTMRDIRAIKQIIKDLHKFNAIYRYSFKELAKMFQVSERTISRWFNGENLPQPVYIPMIKKLIEISKEKKEKRL